MPQLIIDLTEEQMAESRVSLGHLHGKRDDNGPRDATEQELAAVCFGYLRGLCEQRARELSEAPISTSFDA